MAATKPVAICPPELIIPVEKRRGNADARKHQSRMLKGSQIVSSVAREWLGKSHLGK